LLKADAKVIGSLFRRVCSLAAQQQIGLARTRHVRTTNARMRSAARPASLRTEASGLRRCRAGAGWLSASRGNSEFGIPSSSSIRAINLQAELQVRECRASKLGNERKAGTTRGKMTPLNPSHGCKIYLSFAVDNSNPRLRPRCSPRQPPLPALGTNIENEDHLAALGGTADSGQCMMTAD
jgi:hypothetical protein